MDGSHSAGARWIRFAVAIVGSLAVLAVALVPSSRAAGCTTSWTGTAGDGLWTTAGNWDHGVPGATSDVCIALSGTYSISLTASQSIESLTLGGSGATPTLTVQSGATLNVGDSTTASLTLVSGTLVNSGSVEVNPDGDNAHNCAASCTASVPGSASAEGGAATGTAIVLNNVSLDASGTGSGAFNMQGNSNALTADVGSGYTVALVGAPTVSLGNIGGTAIAAVSAGVVNDGTIELTTADANEETAELTVPSGTFTNDGAISSQATAVGVIDGNFDNAAAGTLAAHAPLWIGLPSGTCGAPVTFTQAGAVTVAASQSLSVGGACDSETTLAGGTITNGGTFTVNPDGNNQLNCATVCVASVTASLAATAGSATGAAMTLNNVSLDASGAGSGSFAMTGNANALTAGIGSGYTVALEGMPTTALGDSGGTAIAAVASSITNHGELDLTTSDANSETAQLTIASTATVTNAGELFALNSAKAMLDGNVTNASNGTMTIDAPAVVGETTASCSNTVTFTQDGALDVTSGVTLAVGGNCPSATTLGGGSIDSEGTFEINENGDNQHNCSADCTASVSGTLTADAGSATGNPVLVNNASLDASGTGSGVFELEGNANALTGDIGSGYTVDVDGADGSGTLGNLRGNAVVSIATGITNNGTLDLTTADAETESDLLTIDSGHLTNAGTLETANTAVASIAGAVVNTSSGTVSPGSGLSLTGPSAALTNAGAVSIPAAKTLSTGGSFSQSAGATTVGAGGSLAAPGGAQLSGGTLGGTGAVTANVTNSGATVEPGAADPGTLSVTGSYTQTAAGVLAVRIQSAAQDALAVTGAATLAGTLAITTSGFTPTLGTHYTVVTNAGPQSGQFTTVTGISSGPYSVSYDANDVQLTVTTSNGFPDVSIGDASVRDPDSGTATLTFTVTLSKSAPTGATVHYATANGTAIAPADYTAGSGTVTFAPGVLQQTVSVTVNPDPAPGPDRTLFVNLTAPDGANVATGQGTGSIVNDHVRVDGVSPTTGKVGATVQLTIAGAGFSASPAVSLVRSGAPAIAATGVSVGGAADNQLTATVDLTDAATGTYDVVVALPSLGISATLPAAFAVSAPQQEVTSGETTPGGPGTSAADGAIAGVVTNGSALGGPPVAGAKVTACPAGGGDAATCVSATTGADGTYLLGGLAAGGWQLVVEPPGALFEASGTVTVVADATLHELFALQAPAPIGDGVSVDTPGGTVSSGVPTVNWRVPFGIAWPMKVVATSTPDSEQIVTNFMHIGGGFGTHGDPLNAEGMELFEVRYGPEGTPDGLSSMLQAGFDCSGNAAAACELLGDPSETQHFTSLNVGPSSVRIGLDSGQTLTFTTYGEQLVPLNTDGYVSTDDSAVPASTASGSSALDNPFAQDNLALQPSLGPAGSIFGTGPFGGPVSVSARPAIARRASARFHTNAGTASRSTNLTVQRLPGPPPAPTGTAQRQPISNLPTVPFPQCVSHASRQPTNTIPTISINPSSSAHGTRQPVTGGMQMMVNGSAHGPFSGSNSPVSWGGGAAPAPDGHGARAHAADSGCPGSPPTPLPPDGFGGYIDPSGEVTTTTHVPLAGATVLLSSAAGARAKTAKVPNGSAVMSPANRRNPSTSDALGSFGWDTQPGFYEIAATHHGCRAAKTSIFQVPPPRANLVLRLRCPHLKRARSTLVLKLARSATGVVAAAVVGGHRGTPLGLVTVSAGGHRRATVQLLARDRIATVDLRGLKARAKVTAAYAGDGVYRPSSDTARVP